MRSPMNRKGRQKAARAGSRLWFYVGVGVFAVGITLLIGPKVAAYLAPTRLPVPALTPLPVARPAPRSAPMLAFESHDAPSSPNRDVTGAAQAVSDASAAGVSGAAPALALPVLAEPLSTALPSSQPITAASAPPDASVIPSVVAHQARRILRSAISAWSTPGLCGGSAEANSVRERVSTSFRRADFDERGHFYLDPRLPEDAELTPLGDLDLAAAELKKLLGLHPARPLVFVYADQELMKASACINEDVVAFYDGALHLVANRADSLASVLHEYSHHALFSSGLMAPTWAQEGIAMHVAKEKWWRDARYLRAMVDGPFPMDVMDRSIAYKLAPEQAIAFYVQSAAIVECVLRTRKWPLRELFAVLAAGASSDSESYDLPELDRPSFLRDCVTAGL